MAILDILTFPAASLKQVSKPVEEVTPKITDFVKDLFETMYGTGNGIGLAAPQVGENLKIFVMDVPIPHDDNDDKPEEEHEFTPNPICMINPKIVHHEGVIVYEEGCLSCPDLIVGIERAAGIIVESLDAEGRAQSVELTDLPAICTQHEMDHLEGKLLTDYLSRLKRDRYRKGMIRARKDDEDI